MIEMIWLLCTVHCATNLWSLVGILASFRTVWPAGSYAEFVIWEASDPSSGVQAYNGGLGAKPPWS